MSRSHIRRLFVRVHSHTRAWPTLQEEVEEPEADQSQPEAAKRRISYAQLLKEGRRFNIDLVSKVTLSETHTKKGNSVFKGKYLSFHSLRIYLLLFILTLIVFFFKFSS